MFETYASTFFVPKEIVEKSQMLHRKHRCYKEITEITKKSQKSQRNHKEITKSQRYHRNHRHSILVCWTNESNNRQASENMDKSVCILT